LTIQYAANWHHETTMYKVDCNGMGVNQWVYEQVRTSIKVHRDCEGAKNTFVI